MHTQRAHAIDQLLIQREAITREARSLHIENIYLLCPITAIIPHTFHLYLYANSSLILEGEEAALNNDAITDSDAISSLATFIAKQIGVDVTIYTSNEHDIRLVPYLYFPDRDAKQQWYLLAEQINRALCQNPPSLFTASLIVLKNYFQQYYPEQQPKNTTTFVQREVTSSDRKLDR